VTPALSLAARTSRSAVPRLADPVAIGPAVADATGDDRRIHTRHTIGDLAWLSEARLKYGPSVALIDLSSGGAQIEISSHRLRPGTTVVFEIRARNRTLAIPANVLRAHVARLTPHPTYRAALVFKHAFDLKADGSSQKTGDRIDVAEEYTKLSDALRRLYDSTGWTADRIAAAVQPTEMATAEALAITQASGAERAGNPLSRETGRLLRVLTNGISSGAAAETIIAQVADCLKHAVPTRAIKLIKADEPLIRSAEAIHFDVPSADAGLPDRLVVEFPRRCHLEPWHLQFLKASAQLLTVVREADRLRSASSNEAAAALPTGWRRVVVRYLDGQLVKGFCDEFSPATGQIQVCAAPNGPRESRVALSLKHLKAVFFVHDLEGGAARQGPDNHRESGRRIDVTFADGELLSGTTLSYTRDGAGFFVYPVDMKSNNSRTYVVAAAVRHVQFP
jgi:uncharacterized protein DUF6982